MFLNVLKVIQYFFSPTMSNSTAERLFSVLKEVKTDRRNRLGSITLSLILKVKCGLKCQLKISRGKVELKLRLIKQVLKVKANAISNECIAMTQNILYSVVDLSVGEPHEGVSNSD